MFHLAVLIIPLILYADTAYAGPVAAVAAFVGKSVILKAVAQIALSMALSAISQKLMAKKMAKQQSAPKTEVAFDIEMGDTTPLAICVGEFATAGKRKWIGSWGKNTRFITQVIEVSALPVPGFRGLWINAEKATVDFERQDYISGAAPDATGSAASGDYAMGHPCRVGSFGDKWLTWIKWVDGNQTAADPYLTWLSAGDQYPMQGAGLGKAYAIITVLFDKDNLDSLPDFLIEPTPLPMYDPRKDSSTGGLGTHRWGDRATYEPSTNGAVIAYNIARGIYWGTEWVYGGKNLPAWRLPRSEWIAAMNSCDRGIPQPNTGTLPAYRVGMEIPVDVEAADVLEELGRACNTRFAEVGGKIKPCTDLPASAIYSITDDDIIITEGQGFDPFYPLTDTYNVISATYPDPALKWVTKDAPERTYAEERALDGGRYLPVGVNYPACPFPEQVQRLMHSQMLDFRRMRQHTFSLPPAAFGLEPLDMINWVSVRNGYESKKFIVEQISSVMGMNVTVALREVDPSDYDWSPSQVIPWQTVTPVNPIPIPQGITGWTAVAVTLQGDDGRGRRVGIQVACGANEVGIDHIRIQIEQAGVIKFDVSRPYAAPYIWTLTDVTAETTYRVRGALVSEFTGLFEWSPWITVTTPTESIWLDDLSDEIIAEFERLAAEGGIKTVDSLPVAGDFADQIVMLRSSKQFYRWDAPTAQWSTAVYAGVADSSITAAKIVSDNILSRHIASSNILATHIGAGQVTSDKINVGVLSAITANVGLLRTATSGARMEIHGDMLLVYDAGGQLRVRLGRLV